MSRLTPKQDRFLNEYLVDLNATQAAIRSGYSCRSAGKIGAQLLEKTVIQEMIRRRQDELRERIHVRQEQVLVALAAIAFADMADYVEADEAGERLRPLSSLSPAQRLAVAEAKQHKNGFRLRLHSKLKALDLLAKHLGLFQER
jgi:phage terminase small subunit